MDSKGHCWLGMGTGRHKRSKTIAISLLGHFEEVPGVLRDKWQFCADWGPFHGPQSAGPTGPTTLASKE